ncbi:MAG: hypothetical protein LBC71_05030 [Oscillospiraceae bacterium]|jgi:hypothetical protein|nr:hypothetical protein [Oscillospiraceae bacterium]
MANPTCPKCNTLMELNDNGPRERKYNPYNKTMMTAIPYKCPKCRTHHCKVEFDDSPSGGVGDVIKTILGIIVLVLIISCIGICIYENGC